MLFGFKTRWAVIALFGFCLLTAFLPHVRRTGYSTSEEYRHGRLSRSGAARPRRVVARPAGGGEPSSEGCCRGALPTAPRERLI